jgi:lytic murein transglycosylase
MHFSAAARRAILTALVIFAAGLPAHAADCGRTGAGFDAWLARYKAKAAGQGISPSTVAQTLSGVTYDPKVVRLDRSQKSFKLSFEQFYARRVSASLLNRGRRLMSRHAGLLDRIEKRYGVPAEVLISIWGLETNYGADTSGRYSIVRSLATLSFDCRRSAFFTNELTNALLIVERGYMPAGQLRGGWAGEIGQTQFLPHSYVRFAVDFDGDGRRDLIHSVPDLLASTANFLKGHGWQAGQGWGPGSANYKVLNDWNRASVYQRTIAAMADRLN